MLPVDGDDEEIHMVTRVPEPEHQLGDDVCIRVIVSIIETYVSMLHMMETLYHNLPMVSMMLMGFSLSPLNNVSANCVDWVQDTAAADTGNILAS